MDTLKVRDAKDVEEVVRAAIAGDQPLEIIGHGTRRAIGHPMATNAVLDLSALNAVSAYEPNELIITVQAGAPLADVQSLIDSKNQQFAFEPMDTSALLGVSGNGTIGGMIGAGLAGPRRIKAGGARDHLLGAHAVSGFGDSFKTGGRVVKNVTGYDLCKLLAGSWGTLAVMTEVTLKVMPKPESERTLVLAGLDDVTANRAMTAALGSPYDVSGAAHLPNSAFRPAAGTLAGLLRLPGGRSRCCGWKASPRRWRIAPIRSARRSRHSGRWKCCRTTASATAWSAIRDVEPFAAGGALGAWPVWRIVCPPASGGALGQALARDSGGDVIYDWGGGLIWAALPPKPDAQAALVRQRVEAAGGHAVADPGVRADPAECRRLPSAGRRPRRAEPARAPQLRSQDHPQPRPDAAGERDMKTEFSLTQLADPDIAEADKILRACVHCGFCTATCPTYVLLGDELDSPRGRIYLIKEMLEKDKPPTAEVVKHIDRCLSCLACMTTCPSGVHYMHLVDQARVRIERDYSRPLAERALRAVLALVLPRPKLFRASMIMARLARPFAALLPASKAAATPGLLRRIKAMLALAPNSLPAPGPSGGSVFAATGERRGRVALLQGCAQQVLAPRINQAAINLLTRHGIEVVLVKDEQCCGALTHHLGQDGDALARARANINVWKKEAEQGGLDAILITASGCGTVIKDYGFMLREDRDFAGPAAQISALAKDITEFLGGIELAPTTQKGDVTVAYHSACSLQHGQKITGLPKELLSKNGFVVKDVPESHLCCGSAGTYNILQPDIASRLRDRKIANLATVKPDMIAAGNIGCMVQIAGGTSVPVVHTIELLDWATGGPKPGSIGQG